MGTKSNKNNIACDGVTLDSGEVVINAFIGNVHFDGSVNGGYGLLIPISGFIKVDKHKVDEEESELKLQFGQTIYVLVIKLVLEIKRCC